MAKQGEETKGQTQGQGAGQRSIIEETKGAVGDEIREKVTEKAIEVIEKAIAKLEEVLA